MSNCDACASRKGCKYHGSSNLYHKDENTPVIALLGQPNSGKSTIFNMITGSHQHVGNWPGKTVDQKEGEFHYNGQRMILADLPGSYSLSAGSDEEVITRDYITSGNADLVLVMADASQLKRSLYMLADFAGTPVPAVLVLNMMDVAKGQGIVLDTAKLAQKLGIPVVPMSAIRKKDYQTLYRTIETALTEKPIISCEKLPSAEAKMAYIDALLDGVLTTGKTAANAFTKFDQLALSPVKGKLLAFGIILVIFLLAMVFAGIVGGIGDAVIMAVAELLRTGMGSVGVHPLLISLVCDVLANVLYFALMMWIVYRVFGARLSPKEERVGLIMELPPYHKPNFRNILYVTFQRTVDIFLRALRVISIVSIVFFILTYGFGGSAESSILYKVGVLIEPVTIFFGLKWEAFLAFCASAISKESLLGVLNTLYGTGGSLVSSTFGAKASGAAAVGISEILAANFTKAEGLAFIFAISFNMPCVSALAATARETHSVKWTAKIGVFYTVAALLISCVVYHIGLLVF